MIRKITILFILIYSISAFAQEHTLDFPRFGRVTVYNGGNSQEVVLFLSGEAGWNAVVSDSAKQLASRGAMVVGVDIRHYLQALRASAKGCAYPAADLEDLSKFVQKSYESTDYIIPYVTGYSAGATLAYVALVQAPSNTFSGGIGVDFCPELKILKSFCKGKGLESTRRVDTFHFSPAKLLDEPWVTLDGKAKCAEGSMQKFTSEIHNGKFVQLAHGDEWSSSLIQEFSKLYAQKHSTLHPSESIAKAPEVKDLPLIELPVEKTESKTMAVIVSGDGGWASIDREIGNYISQKGIPVVGWNSLQYFWKKRTADGSARDLQRILQHYLASWKKENVILIGYSFGADVLPFMVNRLPSDLQQKVKSISLLGLDKNAEFEFHVTDWINSSAASAQPTKPEVEKIKGPRVLCFYGEDEADSMCVILSPKVVTRIQLSGGHHFGGDYQAIAMRILKESSI